MDLASDGLVQCWCVRAVGCSLTGLSDNGERDHQDEVARRPRNMRSAPRQSMHPTSWRMVAFSTRRNPRDPRVTSARGRALADLNPSSPSALG